MEKETDDRKAHLRDRFWSRLEQAGVDRFPGARGRIPNFTGAEDAAERLRDTEVWREARTLKANPDSPQRPVRQRALEDGKIVFMAVPRLADPNPFFLLDPEEIGASPREASSIKGASRAGRQVSVEALEPVDLVVAGAVAADRAGARLGKGGGFSDLEYAVGTEAGLISPETPTATTIHPFQLADVGTIPMTDHDVPLDLVVTPEEVIVTDTDFSRPGGVLWDDLPPEKIGEIPLLQQLSDRRNG